MLSLDLKDAEGQYRVEPVDHLTPDEIFERRWALTILERVLGKLREEFATAGKEDEFRQLQAFITGEQPRTPYQDVAAELGVSEGAVKASVHRLRGRFGRLLREEIADTVANPDVVDDELRHLLQVIAPWEPRHA